MQLTKKQRKWMNVVIAIASLGLVISALAQPSMLFFKL